MSPHDGTYDSMMAHLTSVAKDLHKLYGYSSVQLCIGVQMGDESTALFAGAGSVHERTAIAREFVLRADEQVKIHERSRYA